MLPRLPNSKVHPTKQTTLSNCASPAKNNETVRARHELLRYFNENKEGREVFLKFSTEI